MTTPAPPEWMAVGEPVRLSFSLTDESVTVGEPFQLSWIHTGAPTQTMLTAEGYYVWVDAGPPDVVVGAAVGDLYIDSDSGMLYRLD